MTLIPVARKTCGGYRTVFQTRLLDSIGIKTVSNADSEQTGDYKFIIYTLGLPIEASTTLVVCRGLLPVHLFPIRSVFSALTFFLDYRDTTFSPHTTLYTRRHI